MFHADICVHFRACMMIGTETGFAVSAHIRIILHSLARLVSELIFATCLTGQMTKKLFFLDHIHSHFLSYPFWRGWENDSANINPLQTQPSSLCSYVAASILLYLPFLSPFSTKLHITHTISKGKISKETRSVCLSVCPLISLSVCLLYYRIFLSVCVYRLPSYSPSSPVLASGSSTSSSFS